MAFSLTDVKNLYDTVDGFLNPTPPPFTRTSIEHAGNKNANKLTADESELKLQNSLSVEAGATGPMSLDTGYAVYHYPEDLLTLGSMSERYPHAMFFFINVSSKSLLGSSASNTIRTDILGGTLDLTDRTQGSAIGTSLTTDSTATQAPDGGSRLIASRHRSVACIMLPIPLNVQAAYNIGYGQGGADGLMGSLVANTASGGVGGLLDVLKSSETYGGIAKEATGRGLKFLESFANTSKSGKPNGFGDYFGKTQNLSGLKDKIEGTMLNPRKEQIFSGVDFRTFSFSWNIPIRSTNEWIMIRKIIALFKKHMHPELQAGSNGSYLVLPDEFDIQFFEKSNETFSESRTLPKIATSVIESLQVNYTPQGSWVAFEGTMIPPFVQISMSVKELEPLVRSMVADIEDVTTDVREGSLDRTIGRTTNQDQINRDNAKYRGF